MGPTQTFLRSENFEFLRGPAGEICSSSKDYVTSTLSRPPNSTLSGFQTSESRQTTESSRLGQTAAHIGSTDDGMSTSNVLALGF
jgi:hypothetical protein